MSWLLSPLAWLFLAALLAPVAWRLKSRLLAGVCVAVAVVAFAASTPLLANLLVRKLEHAVAEVPQCDVAPPGTVVVLAGGVDRPPRDRMDFAVMDQASKRRMERGVQYWRERAGRRMVIAGGALGRGRVARADLMVEYALWLGLPPDALRTERHSANTHQNARELSRLEPSVPRRIALVTSAVHMPRARMEFRSFGFDVCPLATDRRAVRARGLDALLPRVSAIVKTQMALHEFAGIAYFQWRGWLARAAKLTRIREPATTLQVNLAQD